MASKASDAQPAGLRYRFGIISDAHAISGNSTYANCDVHLAATLKNLHALGAQEIISCGDSTVNGTQAEWDLYNSILEASPFGRAKVHECNGNHDPLDLYLTQSNNGTLAGGRATFALDLFGDRFLFLGLEKQLQPKNGDVFVLDQIVWLDTELQKHYGVKGKNVWLVEHALWQGWGPGDNPDSPGYTNGLRTSDANNAALKMGLEAYPEVIMLHGHSHIQLEDRDTHGLVVFGKYGCYQLHVPSVTAQKYFDGSTLRVDSSLGQSQCWLCEVYETKIVFRGIYGYTGEEIPNMVYTIETPNYQEVTE